MVNMLEAQKDEQEYFDLESEKNALLNEVENMHPAVQPNARITIQRMDEMRKEILARGNIKVEIAPNGAHIVRIKDE